jgi:hypothetical protein
VLSASKSSISADTAERVKALSPERRAKLRAAAVARLDALAAARAASIEAYREVVACAGAAAQRGDRRALSAVARAQRNIDRLSGVAP